MHSRRVFLRVLAYSGVGGYLWSAAGCRNRQPRPLALEYFTSDEYLTLCAACERILPRDEDPGAGDLDVPVFIDRVLAHDDHRHWGASIREGLTALDGASRQTSAKPFHAADALAQDDLLEDWSDGEPDQAGFFQKLVHLVLEGAFSDPIHGGNKDGRGWALIGFRPCEPTPSHRHG